MTGRLADTGPEDMMTTDTDTLPATECLGYNPITPEDCDGAVEYRMSLSGTGTPIPRCDRHWSDRLDLEERLRVDYPDSSTPPSWFDPTLAGESWEDD